MTIRSMLNEGINQEGLMEWAEDMRRLGWKYYFLVALTFLTGLKARKVLTVLKVMREHGLRGYYKPKTGLWSTSGSPSSSEEPRTRT